MHYAQLTILASYNSAYDIGYMLIPALIAIWGVVMIVKKILQGVKDAKEIDEKIERRNKRKDDVVEEELSDDGAEAELKDLSIKVLLEENRKLTDKINKLEKKTKNKK